MTNETKKSLKSILYNAFKNIEETGGGKEYRYFHGIHVANITQRIIREESLGVDKDLLYVAALFHDIGKVKAVDEKLSIDYKSKGNLEHDSVRSNFLGKYIGNVVSKEMLIKITKVICETPNLEASVECKILRDADELSNFGYMQVWRMVTDAAFTKKNIFEAFKYWIDVGIQNLIDTNKKMFFSYSREVAKKNLKVFVNYIESVRLELN